MQLGGFVAVAEELHFGRAAERLNMTQPPLSRQIMLLEREVGVLLIDRSSRSVRLTPAGRVFLGEARRILRMADETTLAVRRIPRGAGGTVAVGFTAVSVHGMLKSLLRSLGDEFPHIDLVLREMVTSDQVEAIAAGDLDLGFGRPAVTRAGLRSRMIQRERLVLALPTDDDWATRGGALPLGLLEDRALVMYSPLESRYFNELLIGAFAEAGVHPRYTQYVSQVHTMLALVEAGMGWALVPESAKAIHPRGVAFRPLDTAPRIDVQLHAIWRADADNPALASILGLLPELPGAEAD